MTVGKIGEFMISCGKEGSCKAFSGDNSLALAAYNNGAAASKNLAATTVRADSISNGVAKSTDLGVA